MKILFVIPYFMPAISYGGPVKVSFDIAKGLISRGHQLTVATTDVFDETRRLEKKIEIIDGITVLRFRNVSNRLAKKANGYLPFGFIPWFLKNSDKYDVIYCNDFFSIQAMTVGFVSNFRKLPIVIQPHGSLSSVRRSAKFSVIKKILLSLFKNLLGNSRNIIALTRQERSEILAISPRLSSKIVVVPNGLEPDEFENVKKIDLAARFNLPLGRKIIGFVGRLSYIKGIDISFDVLTRLNNSIDYNFLVIGPDEGERSSLEKRAKSLGIADRVTFVGILSGKEKLSVIKSCDLFLFTSRDEGLPMTVLEVAALGVPQVISKECNVPELAECGAGYVHSIEDLDGFARSVESVLNNSTDVLAMSKSAKKMVRERFNIVKVLDSIEQLVLQHASKC